MRALLAFAFLAAITCKAQPSAIVVRGHVPDSCQAMQPAGQLVHVGRIKVAVPQQILLGFDVYEGDTLWNWIQVDRYVTKRYKVAMQEYRSPNCPELIYRLNHRIER